MCGQGVVNNFDLSFLTCRNQNSDIPRASRYVTAHGGTAGRGEDGQNGMPTNRFAQNTAVLLTPQTIEENPLGRVSGSTNNRLTM